VLKHVVAAQQRIAQGLPADRLVDGVEDDLLLWQVLEGDELVIHQDDIWHELTPGAANGVLNTIRRTEFSRKHICPVVNSSLREQIHASLHTI
jgi:hypothetical protein